MRRGTAACDGRSGLSACVWLLARCRFIVVSFSDAEAKLASVERVKEYAEDLALERDDAADTPPPEQWPVDGEVVFDSVVLKYRANLPPGMRRWDTTVVRRGCSSLGVPRGRCFLPPVVLAGLLMMVLACGLCSCL